MKRLLSLPPNLVDCFHDVTGLDRRSWFCTSDPVGRKLGSGGGTAWLLQAAHEDDAPDLPFSQWLQKEPRILLHAGGQSRRLPAYAPSGKILTPVPVFRWERGQRLSQTLLDLQLPLYERIMAAAPQRLHTMIVSGDVFIRCPGAVGTIPDADVVCYGLWLGPEVACGHGVFVCRRDTPQRLDHMLQKPTPAQLDALLAQNLYLTDIGIWLLSDRAIEVLMRKCTAADGQITAYDLYTTFGGALGANPSQPDPEVGALSVEVLPLPQGEFYHYGTTPEIISSTLAVMNIVHDQREILHRSRKPHPAIFTQNADIAIDITAENECLWVENACIGPRWQLANHHVLTGIPANDWPVSLRPGQCVDIVPLQDRAEEQCEIHTAQPLRPEFALRPYGFHDKFRGPLADPATLYMGEPFAQWAAARGICPADIEGAHDLQAARIFPVCHNADDLGLALRWMLGETGLAAGAEVWKNARKVSADDISNTADLRRLTQQRRQLRAQAWPKIAANHAHSVFYQTDLGHAAREFAAAGLPCPEPLSAAEPAMTRMRDAMFRSEYYRQCAASQPAQLAQSAQHADHAFRLLRQTLTAHAVQLPRKDVYDDQIVWARSPVRIDIAGGWTDTPPYCMTEGGIVANIAIELNGQQPLQTYAKPCAEPHIVLRSIDLGATEVVETFDQLADFQHVGSPFSIPKAALALAGFLPAYCTTPYPTLRQQLADFGCGIELTLLSAIPAGSGLGTSSILAATVLAALGDFCCLAWDKQEIGRRTLMLEQMLTTGGGWQDQYGGLLPGVKLLTTGRGATQAPTPIWLPGALFKEADYRACHLLYYTGITRTAKTILAEIVRNMFLNDRDQLLLLRQMRAHALDMADAIQRQQFDRMGRLVRKSWQQNKRLDSGTNPDAVQQITNLIDDLCLGYKLPGAGGGGYLYMVAKDEEAAARIRHILKAHPQNPRARFVEMTLSEQGTQVSRS